MMGLVLVGLVLLSPVIVWSVVAAKRAPDAGTSFWYARELGRSAIRLFLVAVSCFLLSVLIIGMADMDGMGLMAVAFVTFSAIQAAGWGFGIVVGYMSERRLKNAGHRPAWVAAYIVVLLLIGGMLALPAMVAGTAWTLTWTMAMWRLPQAHREI